jgi:nucleotide-binding universal stress UspA family protein
MASGPILIGYDGSPASDHAVRETGALFAGREALVVVVWEASVAYQVTAVPVATLGLAPVPLDVRTAHKVEEAVYEGAQHLADQGVSLAREAGLDAEGLVVADEVSVTDTLVRVAAERDAPAIAVGARGRGAVGELLLGSTSQGVIRRAKCPVVVVRRHQS